MPMVLIRVGLPKRRKKEDIILFLVDLSRSLLFTVASHPGARDRPRDDGHHHDTPTTLLPSRIIILYYYYEKIIEEVVVLVVGANNNTVVTIIISMI